MAGSRPGNRFSRSRITTLHREVFSPIFPIGIADDNGDWRADRLRVPDTGDHFRRVGFDLHSPAAAETLLSAPQFAIDAFQRDRDPGRYTNQRRDQALSMRFTRSLPTKHSELPSYQARVT